MNSKCSNIYETTSVLKVLLMAWQASKQDITFPQQYLEQLEMKFYLWIELQIVVNYVNLRFCVNKRIFKDKA